MQKFELEHETLFIYILLHIQNLSREKEKKD